MTNMDQKALKAHHLHEKFVHLDFNRWLVSELFTIQWWILIVFLIVPWLIWLKWRDKKKGLESVLFGTILIIMTSLIDTLGMDINFWYYPVQIIPVGARAIAFDLSMVPVGFMFLYEYFGQKKAFLFALVIMAGIYAFIAEPICLKLHLVRYIKWNVVYSFFYYILTGLIAKGLVYLVANASNENRN